MRDLPKVNIKGRTYYQDDRLGEFRDVEDHDNIITFDDYRRNYLNEEQLAEYNKSWFKSYRERNCKKCEICGTCKNTDEEIEACNESREPSE